VFFSGQGYFSVLEYGRPIGKVLEISLPIFL
jgi:hypothetical protein